MHEVTFLRLRDRVQLGNWAPDPLANSLSGITPVLATAIASCLYIQPHEVASNPELVLRPLDVHLLKENIIDQQLFSSHHTCCMFSSYLLKDIQF